MESDISQNLGVGTNNGGAGNGLFIYSWDSQSFGSSVSTNIPQVTAIHWSPNGENVAVGSNDGLYVYLWNEKLFGYSPVQTSTAITNVNDVSWSPDGKNLAVATTGGLYVYSWNGQSLSSSRMNHQLPL